MNYKEIEGYPNYLIYEDGRIWSKYKDVWLKPYKDQGYYRVGLWNNCKRKKFRVHRLLALHFIPNPENKPCVDHKDGVTTNNNLSNLRWVTKHENECNQVNAKGVRLRHDTRRKRWEACWSVDGKEKKKYFLTEEEALQHRKLMVDKYYNRPIIT